MILQKCEDRRVRPGERAKFKPIAFGVAVEYLRYFHTFPFVFSVSVRDCGRGVDQTPCPSCTIATISLFVDRLESLPIAILVQAINCDDYITKQRKAQIKQRVKQKNDAQKSE